MLSVCIDLAAKYYQVSVMQECDSASRDYLSDTLARHSGIDFTQSSWFSTSELLLICLNVHATFMYFRIH